MSQNETSARNSGRNKNRNNWSDSTLSPVKCRPIGILGAVMTSMKQWVLTLIIFVLGSSVMAKSTCSIPVESAYGEFKDNALLNERLKKHQKIKNITFSIDLNSLQSEKNAKIQLIFNTTQSKKFETIYNTYNKNVNVWKIDFAKSQIFPQLFKNYLNITQYNSKYYFRLYDMPSEKSIVSLVFDSTHCSPDTKSNVLTRASTTF